jgi:hypothetical protein
MNKRVMKFILLKKLAKKAREVKTHVTLKLRKTKLNQAFMKIIVTMLQMRMSKLKKIKTPSLLIKNQLRKPLQMKQILSIKESHLMIMRIRMKIMKKI